MKRFLNKVLYAKVWKNRKGTRAHRTADADCSRRRGDRMKRREFIAGLGAAAVWPEVGRAQQVNGIRTVGVLMNLSESDAEGQQRFSAFVESLQQSGWVVGRNL